MDGRGKGGGGEFGRGAVHSRSLCRAYKTVYPFCFGDDRFFIPLHLNVAVSEGYYKGGWLMEVVGRDVGLGMALNMSAVFALVCKDVWVYQPFVAANTLRRTKERVVIIRASTFTSE